VRFDPDYTLLAEITFDKPKAMLYQQLKNNDDVIGQILATEALRKRADKKTVSALETALNEAPFYGIRVEASKALGLIHTDEAFAALTASWEQSDARVRDRVVQDIGRFYRPEILTLLTSILNSEKNPAIQASAIQNLGRFQDEKNRDLIRHYLASDSYRNRLADAAVQAIRQLGDPSFVEPLKQVIHEKENRFTSQGLASALDTLASLAKDRDDKTDIYRFISEFINHKKERVKIAAVNALGTLGDARAIAVIETLAQDDLPSPLREMGLGRAAQRSLEKLRKETKLVPQEVIELRDTVNKLKVENSKLQERLDDLESRLDAMKRGTLQGP
jgi:aminopeptidase N